LADAGHKRAGERLAKLMDNLLTEQGRGQEAERLRWFGLNPDGSIGSLRMGRASTGMSRLRRRACLNAMSHAP
jgi:hypothetical protein